jgi:hypothetical protein
MPYNFIPPEANGGDKRIGKSICTSSPAYDLVNDHKAVNKTEALLRWSIALPPVRA